MDPRPICDRLAERGFGHRRTEFSPTSYRHELFQLESGQVVGEMTAHEAVVWLHRGCPVVDGRAQ
jgi:hypothetical protein